MSRSVSRSLPIKGAKILALSLILMVSIAGAVWAESVEKTIEGVLCVKNGIKPTHKTEVLKMTELWRAGTAEDEDTIFGLIPRVGTDAEGNVYVLDSQLCSVSVYSKDGDFLRSLFREGEGPGEVREPRDMIVMSDGRVGLLQETPGEIVFVDAEGIPAGNLKVGADDPNKGGMNTLVACDSNGKKILLSGTEHPPSDVPNISKRINFLGNFEPNGSEKTRYTALNTVYDFADFRFVEKEHMPAFWWCYAIDQDGTVYVVPSRDKYEIQKYDSSGKLDRIISRETKTIKRSEKEFGDMYGIVETALTGMPFETTILMEENAPAIGYMQRGVRVREDGSLWVMSAEGIHGNREGVLVTFDVFSPEGEFLKKVELEGEGDPLMDGIFFVGEDRVVVIKGYLESMAAQFGGGTTYVGDGEEDEEAVVLGVVCYLVEG